MKKILYIIFLFHVCTLSAFSQQWRLGNRRTNVEINYENPQDYYIGGITVSGVQFLDPEAIISLTGLKVGDKITVPGDEISNAIKKLWEQGLIGDVEVVVKKIEVKNIYLEFIIKERPRLTKFTFQGATKSEREDLEDKIDLARGRIVNDALIKNAKNKITEYYLEKGYLYAQVDMIQIKDTILENNIILRVDIDKKNKVRINKITLTGNESFESNFLLKKMKKTKGKNIMNVWTGSKMISKTYEADKDAIVAFYNSRGYRDMQIVSDSVTPYKKYAVNVAINIDEGDKYYFRNITWKGNYIYSTQQLKDILAINKGDVYNNDQLQQKLSFNPAGPDISSLYLDNGYLFFSIDPVEVLIEGDSIDIEMRIYEGEQAIVNHIEVDGNTKTHDHVILREVRTYPGDKFSRADLIRTQRELAALNYFDNESLGMNPVPNQATGKVDIGYSVTEKPNDQVELSGGWGGYYGFVGTVGLVFNNFSLRNIKHPKTWSPLPAGDGQRLAFRVQANGKTYQTYSISFTEPWLGGKKPTSLSVSLQHSVQSQYTSSNTSKSGSLQVTGVTVGIGKRLKWPDDFFTINHTFSILRYTLDNYQSGSSTAAIGYTSGFSNNFSYNLTLSRNSIDNFQFPSSGGSMAMSMTFTPPYSYFNKLDYEDPNLESSKRYKWLEYQKYGLDLSWFTTVWQHRQKSKHKIVFNTRFHGGVIAAYQPGVGVGPFERYIMGGDGLSGYNYLLGSDIIGLRGYTNNSIKPTPSGGVAFDKFVAELRYPISNSPSFSVYVLTFFEAGNSWGTINDVNPFNMYRSAGFGARIFMPAFGLIGIDWGKPFDEVPGLPNPNHKAHVTFTIGQQIR
ncbi:outer membrane protein assembly factor BamA [uncultured Cytophaga sp.]|uniref:outer membrane protein assembly factor BamA n=1 Tax=uncultured Cytophaga sp. TaxID=160238 RepID=UPI002620FFFF|nr:outer membrane protein assembly factor BamA [uncultured Cytophaga sp.]